MNAPIRVRVILGLVLLSSLTFELEGQAWLAPAGQGTFSISTEYLEVDAHTNAAGDEIPNIDLVGKTLTLILDYSFTERLALGLELPYVESRYRGTSPHIGSSVDDGSYHGSISDFRIDTRYKAWDSEAITFTPFASLVIPTHDYETLGHASPGRGLYELGIGFNVGHELTAISPGLFVQGRYSYTFVEKISDLSVNRSNADLLLAYVVHPRVVLHANGRWQETHDGLDFPLAGTDVTDHLHDHDQLGRANHFRAGAGFSYTVASNVDIFANVETIVRAENSHLGTSYSLGVGYNFNSRLRPSPR